MSDKRTDNDSILNESAADDREFPAEGQSEEGSEASIDDLVSQTDRLKTELQESKEKYLRLVAEFDNFRKRTAKEKMETIQTASKDVVVSMLEVLDDADRAQQQLEASSDPDEIKKGVVLVFNKLRNNLKSKGLKLMKAKGEQFNPDIHEAIAEVEAGEKMRGKIVDVVQNGYYLNDKIIRFAKVVVGK
jgi:molecular chaperone GrpE